MEQYKENINSFLVDAFHDLLRLEEAALAKDEFQNLSVHEMHVIEAVYDGNSAGLYAMNEIAAKLSVTASTLTTSVKTLERKGYLIRQKLPEDKRYVKVCLTPLGEKAYDSHHTFHKELVEEISLKLNEEELKSLSTALSTLHIFFNNFFQKIISPKEDK
jgi:DNA-binding MarR family transcriptional regulator